MAPRPRRDRVFDRRARQRSSGYQLNTGPPGGIGRGDGDATGDSWPVGRRDVPGGEGPPPDPAPVPPGRRGDLPVRREVRRACKRSVLEAALAEHRQEALADLDENVLARSSQGPFQSRVRTVPGVGRRTMAHLTGGGPRRRGVAASWRLPYRSAQNYFDAAVAYQERFREQAVDPLLKKAMRRYTRAVLRGLPGSRLQTVFPVDRLTALVVIGDAPAARAWSPWTAAHAADALLLAVWFMLREIEFAAARTQDLEAAGGTVTLRVPLHKAATGGQTELTMRQLRCACRSAVSPLCPYHSAVRHIERLKAAGVWFRDRPLFPDSTGATWEKSSAILLFRRVLMVAGIQTTAVDHTDAPVQLFGGHLARPARPGWRPKACPAAGALVLGRRRALHSGGPEVPHRVLHQTSGCPPPTLEIGSAVAQAPAASTAQAPAIMDIARTEHTQAPRQDTSPAEFSR